MWLELFHCPIHILDQLFYWLLLLGELSRTILNKISTIIGALQEIMIMIYLMFSYFALLSASPDMEVIFKVDHSVYASLFLKVGRSGGKLTLRSRKTAILVEGYPHVAWAQSIFQCVIH